MTAVDAAAVTAIAVRTDLRGDPRDGRVGPMARRVGRDAPTVRRRCPVRGR